MKIQSKLGERGHSLVELMVALVLSSLLIAAGGFVYLSQSSHIRGNSQRDAGMHECNELSNKLSRLIRQAETRVIITHSTHGRDNETPEETNDDISIVFSVPPGYAIWPNHTPPFHDNWIEINWNNHDNDSERYRILIRNASNQAALASATYTVLAGSDHNTNDIRISNLDLTQTNANSISGYTLRLSARTNQRDVNYNRPNSNSTDPLQHIHSCTVSSVISIRN